MNTLRSKLRQTFPTYIILVLALVLLYIAANWVATTVLHMRLDYRVWSIYIPVLLPLLPAIYFLNKKLSAIDFPVSLKSKVTLIIVTLITTSAMLFMLGRYSKESKDMLIDLPNVTSIDTVKTIKYFRLKEYGVNRHGGYHIHYTKSAKRTSNRLNMNVYFALPLLKSRKEGINQFPKYWYGIKFDMWTNGGNATYMRALEQEFVKECQKKIEAMTFDDERYFELVATAPHKPLYEKAINSIPIPKEKMDYFILTPSFKFFNQKAIVALYWILGIFAFGTFMFIAGVSDENFEQKRKEALNSGKDS